MVYSHSRSDQLDHPDPLTFPIKPDQVRLKVVYTTSSQPLVVHRRSIIPTFTRAFTRPQLDQLVLCSVAAKSSPDQIGLRSDITRVQIGIRSGKKIQSDQTRSLHERFSINLTNTRSLLDRLATRSLLAFVWPVKNIRVGSPSDADQGRPPRPLPITHTDQARPVLGCLIELIWSAVGTQLKGLYFINL